jgi:hypothetical protein
VLTAPIFKEISEVFPDITPIDRTSTHAWSHPEVRAAIDATGRKKLLMAGIATEVCLAQSAPCSSERRLRHLLRQRLLGQRDTRNARRREGPITGKSCARRCVPADCGAAALLTDYGMAQVKAGMVQVPDFMRRGAASAR